MAVSVEEAAHAFRERAARERAARELRAAATRTAVEAQIGPLLPPGARAWLIGSLVWGGYGERSDIDVVLERVGGAESTRIEEAVARAAGVQVDLLDFDDLPRGFRERIEREGVLIRGR